MNHAKIIRIFQEENCLNKQGKKVDFDHEIMNHEKGSIQLCVGFFFSLQSTTELAVSGGFIFHICLFSD
jgi:hypothetical protein